MIELNSTLMAREAAQAPRVAAAMLRAARDRLAELGAALRDDPPALVATCARGSSDHAATYGKYLIETRLGIQVASAAPSVSSVYQARLATDRTFLLAISQSGSSPDLLAVVEGYRAGGARVATIVNVEDSPLAALGQHLLPLKAGQERSVAATKTFIASLVMQAALVAQWSEDAVLSEALDRLPAALETVAQRVRFAVPEGFDAARGLFVLGRGLGFSAAQEAALKFKETCEIHAEAFSAAEVRHGPMAIVGEGFPVVAFITSDETGESVREAAREFAARGAQVCSIDARAPQPDAGGASLAELAGHPALEPILMIQGFYFLVSGFALARNLDPDLPRYLSKVTLTR